MDASEGKGMRFARTLSIAILSIITVMAMIAVVVAAQNYTDVEQWLEDLSILGLTFSLTCCAVTSLVALLIVILAAIWIYKDAEKRGKSGVLWVILMVIVGWLILPIIGIIIIAIIWLIVRPPIQPVQPPMQQQPMPPQYPQQPPQYPPQQPPQQPPTQ